MASPELLKLRARFAATPFDPERPPADLRRMIDMFGDAFRLPDGVRVEEVVLGRRVAERLVADPSGPAVLYLHGGGYVIGSPKSHRHLGALLASELGGVVYVLDYRLAPETPFPGAPDDAMAAWRHLLTQHQVLSVAGDSAGGGLAFSLALSARAAGMRLPDSIVGFSPWVELSTENESYSLLGKLDQQLSRIGTAWYAQHYMAGADVVDPRASPARADLAGLPPVLIQVGDHEVFFGDACLMHQRLLAAGVASRLTVWCEMFHVWQLYWPMLKEGRDAVAEAARFIAAASA